MQRAVSLSSFFGGFPFRASIAVLRLRSGVLIVGLVWAVIAAVDRGLVGDTFMAGKLSPDISVAGLCDCWASCLAPFE